MRAHVAPLPPSPSLPLPPPISLPHSRILVGRSKKATKKFSICVSLPKSVVVTRKVLFAHIISKTVSSKSNDSRSNVLNFFVVINEFFSTWSFFPDQTQKVFNRIKNSFTGTNRNWPETRLKWFLQSCLQAYQTLISWWIKMFRSKSAASPKKDKRVRIWSNRVSM